MSWGKMVFKLEPWKWKGLLTELCFKDEGEGWKTDRGAKNHNQMGEVSVSFNLCLFVSCHQGI